MKKPLVGALGLLLACAASQALAADPGKTESKGVLPVPDYTGDIWNRSYLTGDWNGTRTDWANKGFQLEVDWTQVMQSVVSGGRNSSTEYGGNLDYLFNFDLYRMGVIPGAVVSVRAETRYGNDVNSASGQLLPVNLMGLVPFSADDVPIAVTELTYFQFLSTEFGLFVGKLNTFSADPNAFASHRGETQFLNLNFVFSGVTCLLPYSTLGGGAIWLPTKYMTVSSSVFCTQDSSTSTGFNDTGSGWTSASEADFQYQLGNMPGGTNIGLIYAWASDFTNFNGRFSFEPGQGIVTSTQSSTWATYLSGWQYLYTRDPVTGPVNLEAGNPTIQGFGLFWRAGVADSDTNPINWSLSAGVGGVGMIPGRNRDSFGVGYFYSDIATDHLSGILNIENHSQGAEAFYNIAITPATQLTFDAQVVSAPGPNADTGVILGVRLFMRF